MPKNTRVHRCVDALKKAKEESGSAIAICQASTKQGYATGKKLNSSRAYKQIGLVLAEAMGHRVDEIAPLAAAAARVAGSQILRRGAVTLGRNAAPGTAKRGLSVAARKTAKDPEKMKTLGAGLKAGYKKIKDKFTGAGDEGTIPDTPEARKELEDQEKSNEELGEGKIMNKYVRTLVEKKAWTPPEGMTTSKSPGQEDWRGEGYASEKSTARGGPGRTAEIPDPKDRKAAKKAVGRAREKMQLAPEQSTKVSGAVALELSDRQKAAKKAREDSSTVYSKLGHLFLETTPEAYYRRKKGGPLEGGPAKHGPPKPKKPVKVLSAKYRRKKGGPLEGGDESVEKVSNDG